MKSAVPIFLVITILLSSSGCQTTPKPPPIDQLSEAQQLEMFKYGAVNPPNDNTHFDWPQFWKGTAAVILFIPLIFIPHTTAVDRGS